MKIFEGELLHIDKRSSATKRMYIYFIIELWFVFMYICEWGPESWKLWYFLQIVPYPDEAPIINLRLATDCLESEEEIHIPFYGTNTICTNEYGWEVGPCDEKTALFREIPAIYE
jgi:hypothetical protein